MAVNTHILSRLQGIQTILNGVHQASAPMTNNTIGAERQAFIDNFLAAVFPNHYRFGTGDATDRNNNRSGQLDVVIEYPFAPSLPIPSGQTRLYLAESIAAVIEVKSNIASQWTQATHTASQLAPLSRDFGGTLMMGQQVTTEIPFFVVGYTGWNQIQTLQANLATVPNIHGILVINQGLFVSSPQFGSMTATGAWALWGLISCLHTAMSTMKITSFTPLTYAIK
jgi:hypothetical protein